MDISVIRELSLLQGVSGDEGEVRDFIEKQLPSDCEKRIDPAGNLIVCKKGKSRPGKSVMLCAHMDEVGFIVTYVTEEGLLKFTNVGGITPSAVFGRRVRFKNGTLGVIAAKAVHMVKGEEKDKQPKIEDLWIDIGAGSREEAEKLVQRGDCCCFESEFFEFGSGFIKGKALDDRIGCAILLELLKKELPYDITCVFTVQEEIGARGAGCAAYNVRPDFAIVLEATTACDIAGVEGAKRVCEAGKGAVVSFMDRSTAYDRELYRLAFDIAAEKKIPVQTKTMVAGGNDSGAIHKTAGGVRTAAVSVPTRYLHTPACVMKLSDVQASAELAEELCKRLCET